MALDRITQLAEAVADGQTVDWTALDAALTDDDQEVVSAFRKLALVGGLFATASTSLRAAYRDRTPLPPGSTWGTLRIDAYIGRGRFGDVYRAWDAALHRTDALKLIAGEDEPGRNDTAVVDEGRLMARVRHPNVAAIYGAQRIGNVAGLWMEFIEGRTLEAEFLERAPFGANELTRVAVDLCAALAAVHGAGLVHRDVKASNVIREPGGRLVLGDFGTGLLSDAQDSRRTGFVGTPVYMAPEIYQRGAATARSDLYSLGVLLFHSATGRFPVTGRSMPELQAAHETAERSPLSSLRPDLLVSLQAAIDRLLEPDPAGRFESAELTRQAFVRPEHRGRHRLAAVAVAVVLTVGVFIAWRFSTTGSGVGQPAGGPALVHLDPRLQATVTFRGAAFNRRLIACQDNARGNVAVCDLATGDVRVLRPWEAADSFAPAGRSLLLSPDGGRVAYQWLSGPSGPDRIVSLNVIDTSGRRALELWRGNSRDAVLPHRWLADGSALLVSEADGDGRKVSRSVARPDRQSPSVHVWEPALQHGHADWRPGRATVTERGDSRARGVSQLNR